VLVRLCVSANADTTHRCHAGIFLSNVRSPASKLDELQLLMVKNRDFSTSAVLCFTETWLCGLIPDSALQLAGFQLLIVTWNSPAKLKVEVSVFILTVAGVMT